MGSIYFSISLGSIYNTISHRITISMTVTTRPRRGYSNTVLIRENVSIILFYIMADIISLQSKHLIHGFFEGYKIVIRILKLQVMTQGFDQNTVKLILKELNFTS